MILLILLKHHLLCDQTNQSTGLIFREDLSRKNEVVWPAASLGLWFEVSAPPVTACPAAVLNIDAREEKFAIHS